MASSADPGEGSYYAVLNVAPEASEEEIKRAYRSLASTYHPDKTQDPALREDAARIFTKVQEAYEVGGWLAGVGRRQLGGGWRHHHHHPPQRCCVLLGRGHVPPSGTGAALCRPARSPTQ